MCSVGVLYVSAEALYGVGVLCGFLFVVGVLYCVSQGFHSFSGSKLGVQPCISILLGVGVLYIVLMFCMVLVLSVVLVLFVVVF